MYNDNVVELNDPYYLNSCTMKSCEFIDEDYLLCGSDKWDIYCWEIPKERKGEVLTVSTRVIEFSNSINKAACRFLVKVRAQTAEFSLWDNFCKCYFQFPPKTPPNTPTSLPPPNSKVIVPL